MQSKYLITGLTCAGIALITTLSSFYKPQTSSSAQDPRPDPIEYRSNAKVVNQAGCLTLSSAFENDYYTPSHTEGFFYTEIEAAKWQGELERNIPLNLSLVIDRSGSMGGDKIINARNAAKYIVDQMNSDDYLSIVIYDGSIEVLQSTTRVINKQQIKSKIDRIVTRGGTNLMGGAQMGYDEVKRNYKSGYINRVLLLSDGQANEGITDPRQIEKIVRNQNNINGISISTFGLGNDYNEDLMTSMAESGMGNYYFISNAENMAGIFEKELHGLQEVIAQNATLEITVPENVNIQKVYGYRFDQVGRKLTIPIHNIFAEERKGVLIKFNITRQSNMVVRFSTQLSFRDLTREQTLSTINKNTLEFTNRNDIYNEHFNEWVSAQVALYESNERLEQAMKEVDKGNYEKAKVIVKENKEYMASKAPLVSKSVELQESQTNNARYDSDIQQVESMPVEEKKYMQKSFKSTNYEIRAKKKR